MGFRRKAYLWAFLWVLCPPLLLIPFVTFIIRPAIKGKEPKGIKYVFWVISLIFWGVILDSPLGVIESILIALKNVYLSQITLVIDLIISILTIFLIYLAFRKSKNLHLYLPLNKFKIKWYMILLMLLSFFPLIIIIFTVPAESYRESIAHPLMIALINCIVNKFYIGVIIGFLGIGIFGPVLEEFIFRGLLLEQSHDLKRSKFKHYILDLIVCIFFGLLHLPLYFISPFIFSVIAIFLRRKTKSLIPSILMHCIWNTCVTVQTIVMCN